MGSAGTIAVVLARVVVPLWLATGAVLKLMDLSPAHLPAAIIKWFGGNGIDLLFVLRLSIATELIVAGVMVLLPPLARWIGVAMLATFLPVLIGDLALGASSCGCYGAIEVNPWVTLVIDVTFLLGLLFLGRHEPRLAMTRDLPTSKVLIAGVWSLLSVVVAFGLSAPAATVNGDSEGGSVEVGSGVAQALPANGMELYFSGSLDIPATAVAVPERDGFPTENLQAFDCPECRLAELPAGIDWFLQTPVLVRLLDGVVECAAEVEPMAPECLSW
jgi:hypothetical protein